CLWLPLQEPSTSLFGGLKRRVEQLDTCWISPCARAPMQVAGNDPRTRLSALSAQRPARAREAVGARQRPVPLGVARRHRDPDPGRDRVATAGIARAAEPAAARRQLRPARRLG